MKEIIIFLVLFAYSPNHCDRPGCAVLHLPRAAYLKIYKTVEEVNNSGLKNDTEVYRYDFEKDELTMLSLIPIVAKEEIGKVTGWKIKEGC